ncbi:PQQ-binding-like beta-propeller repeat protein (plasmid) [Streptomyces enissocaesilis]|nr:PQQ-binding-like beta-propeller repeat protein [Streptomyces enissocaesilis]
MGSRYELVAFVGRGGMGEVWEGRDRVIERRVAVKLLPHDRQDSYSAQLFFREARTAGALNHAGVVTIFDLGQDPADGTLYLVMEFLTGRDLDTVLREDGPPPVPTAVDWVAQTAAALQTAHSAGIVHRDLKPANLMLTPDGQVKILDFGIARYMAATHKSSKVIGTIAYMPPERFSDLPADARSDLYSLGCVFHELLTGRTPFQATERVAMMAAHLHTTPEPPSKTRPGIPATLDDLVTALLAKDPDDRPSSAAEVCDRLFELPTSTTAVNAPPHPSVEEATPATAPLTGTDAGQRRAPEMEPPRGISAPARRISRRTALRLGIGAGVAAVGTAAGTAALLFDSPDPRVLWRYATGAAVRSSPAVVDGVVYVDSGDAHVYALDAATGKKKWAFDTGEETGSTDLDSGSPLVVVDGVVYFAGYTYTIALDAATGNKKWGRRTGDGGRGDTSVTVAAGVVYTVNGPGVTALDAATGDKRWSIETDPGLARPTVVDGILYIGGYNNAIALDTATGDIRWSVRIDALAAPSPAVVDGVVYMGGNGTYALDAATGEMKWFYEGTSSSPKVVDEVVYVGGDKKVFALQAATGRRKWIFDTGYGISTSPAVVDGDVYVGSGIGGKVFAVGAADGKGRWSWDAGNEISSSPVVVDGILYVGSMDRNVYALKTTLGDSPD